MRAKLKVIGFAILAILAGLMLASGILFLFVQFYHQIHPENMVSVEIQKLPHDGEALTVFLVNNIDKPTPYNVYSGNFIKKAESPLDSYEQYTPSWSLSNSYSTNVEWYDADYIGVVYGSNRFELDPKTSTYIAKWVIAWFASDSNSIIEDEDKLKIDITKVKPENHITLSDQEIKQLKLDSVDW